MASKSEIGKSRASKFGRAEARKGTLAQEVRRASAQCSGMQKFMKASSMFKINHYSKRTAHHSPHDRSCNQTQRVEPVQSQNMDTRDIEQSTRRPLDLSASPSTKKSPRNFYSTLEEEDKDSGRSPAISRELSEDGNGLINIACGFEDTMGRVASSPHDSPTVLPVQDMDAQTALCQGVLTEPHGSTFYSPRFHESNHSRTSSGGPISQVFEHKKHADNLKKITKEFGIKEAVTEMSWEVDTPPPRPDTHRPSTSAAETGHCPRELEPNTERKPPLHTRIVLNTRKEQEESEGLAHLKLMEKRKTPQIKKKYPLVRPGGGSLQRKMEELSASRGGSGVRKALGSPQLMRRDQAFSRYKKKHEKQIETTWKASSASSMEQVQIVRKFEGDLNEAKSPLAKALKKRPSHKFSAGRKPTTAEPLRRQSSSTYPYSLHLSSNITPDKPARVQKLEEKSIVDDGEPVLDNFEEELQMSAGDPELVLSPDLKQANSRNMRLPLNQSSIEVKQHSSILQLSEIEEIRQSTQFQHHHLTLPLAPIPKFRQSTTKKILSPIQQQSEPITPTQNTASQHRQGAGGGGAGGNQDLPRPFTFLELKGPESREELVIGAEQEIKVVKVRGSGDDIVCFENQSEEWKEQEESNNNPNNYQDRDSETEEREKLKRQLKRLESQLKAMEDQKREKVAISSTRPFQNSLSLSLNDSSRIVSPQESHSSANVKIKEPALDLRKEVARHVRTKSSNQQMPLQYPLPPRKDSAEQNSNNRPTPPSSASQYHPGYVQSSSSNQLPTHPHHHALSNPLPPAQASQGYYPMMPGAPMPPPMWGMAPAPPHAYYPYPAYPGYYSPGYIPMPVPQPIATLSSAPQTGFSSRNPSISGMNPHTTDQRRPQLNLNSMMNNNQQNCNGLFSPLGTGSIRNGQYFAVGSTVDSQAHDVNTSNPLVIEDLKKGEVVFQDFKDTSAPASAEKRSKRSGMLSSASPTSQLRKYGGLDSKFGMYSSHSRKLLHSARGELFTSESGRSHSCARKHSQDVSFPTADHKNQRLDLISPNQEDEFQAGRSGERPSREEICSPMDSLIQTGSPSGQRISEKSMLARQSLVKMKSSTFGDHDSKLQSQDNLQFRTTTGFIDISASSITSRKKSSPPAHLFDRNSRGRFDNRREDEEVSEVQMQVMSRERHDTEEDDEVLCQQIQDISRSAGSPQPVFKRAPPSSSSRHDSLTGGLELSEKGPNHSTTFGEVDNARLFLGKNKQMVITSEKRGQEKPFSEQVFAMAKQSHRYEPEETLEEDELADTPSEGAGVVAPPLVPSAIKKSVTIDLFLTKEEKKQQIQKKKEPKKVVVEKQCYRTAGVFSAGEEEDQQSEELQMFVSSNKDQLPRNKSLAQVFQQRKLSFIEKKTANQGLKKKVKRIQKSKEELRQLRREMVKRKSKPDLRKESKSVDAFPQILSRDPSRATVFTDLSETPAIDLIRSPGATSSAMSEKRRKEPSLEVQIRLAQGLKPKIDMKEARMKAKMQSQGLPQKKSKFEEEKKRQARKELSQKKKQYDRKLRDNLKKKTKVLQDMLTK